MTITNILALSAIALAIGLLRNKSWQGWLLFLTSILAVYWLQPASPIRHLDFWLPTATLGLVLLSWAITRPPHPIQSNPASFQHTFMGDGLAGLAILLVMVSIGLTRYLGPACCIIPTTPPELTQIGLAAALILVSVVALVKWSPSTKLFSFAGIAILLGIFIILKTNHLTQAASAWFRALAGQETTLARVSDISWLGYSYIAFRLIHTLRDRQAGRLPLLSLRNYVTYVIFFPSLPAGPIDRVERFSKDLSSPRRSLSEVFMDGGERVTMGLFKKFVLADSLALMALSPASASQVTSSLWLWVMVYAYAFRIYFDFSGYTDIAIGLGRWVGIKLPENFDRPYLKQNMTAFWNSWHITLALWFRAYFFNPLVRALRSMKKPLPATAVILLGQFCTMVLIGLWHGVTWNFLFWGAWHATGLFLHNRWLDFYRTHLGDWTPPHWLERSLAFLSTFITFNYVTLGWVWFALPEPAQSLAVFHKLLGL